jgi:hypothetical protein
MTNLLEQAINVDDCDRAAKIIRDALGIESDDVTNYCFPKTWSADREQRARQRSLLSAHRLTYAGVKPDD